MNICLWCGSKLKYTTFLLRLLNTKSCSECGNPTCIDGFFYKSISGYRSCGGASFFIHYQQQSKDKAVGNLIQTNTESMKYYDFELKPCKDTKELSIFLDNYLNKLLKISILK